MGDLTTNCTKCIFTVKDGKTQTGCELERIEKYRENGVVVIEAEDLEDNEFYVIQSWCSAYREEDWIEDRLDPKSDVLEEMKSPMGFIVIVDDENSADKLAITLNSILENVEEPSFIVIANNSSNDYVEIINSAIEYFSDKDDVIYKVTDIKEENCDDHRVVDISFNNFRNGFYTILKSGSKIPLKIEEVLNHTIISQIKKPAFIEGWDGINGETVQCAVHKFMNGNSGQLLSDKAKAAQDANDNKVFYTWKELQF
mgnify:FL=1|tara:strand:+ start:136 stop:903 length:768 start_codon:yes stop_codon:yes gene_type:complete